MPKPELSDPITLRLPVDVLDAIERIGRASDRTRSWVMVRALRLYLAGEGADILAIAKGLEQIEGGDSRDGDEVIAEIEALVRGKVA